MPNISRHAAYFAYMQKVCHIENRYVLYMAHIFYFYLGKEYRYRDV